MPGKYGSASINVLLVDGYDLLTLKPKALTYKIQAVNERIDGLGEAIQRTGPTGLSRATFTQTGGFFDDSADGIHDLLVQPAQQQTVRILVFGVAGNAVGRNCVGASGAYMPAYEVQSTVAGLSKANLETSLTGFVDDNMRILNPYGAKTASWNTKTDGVPYDGLAASAAGGAGYLQVNAVTGFTGFLGKIKHSTDNTTYTDLITFTNVTAAHKAQRVTVSGTVNRYLCFDGACTGSGSITVFVGFERY